MKSVKKVDIQLGFRQKLVVSPTNKNACVYGQNYFGLVDLSTGVVNELTLKGVDYDCFTVYDATYSKDELLLAIVVDNDVEDVFDARKIIIWDGHKQKHFTEIVWPGKVFFYGETHKLIIQSKHQVYLLDLRTSVLKTIFKIRKNSTVQPNKEGTGLIVTNADNTVSLFDLLG